VTQAVSGFVFTGFNYGLVGSCRLVCTNGQLSIPANLIPQLTTLFPYNTNTAAYNNAVDAPCAIAGNQQDKWFP
jgi:hypothetical protein